MRKLNRRGILGKLLLHLGEVAVTHGLADILHQDVQKS